MNQSDGERTDLPVKGLAYKRPLDLGILLFAYVLILPVWVLVLALISIAIWLGNRGPVFYRQRRIGKDGHVFIANKFRTMVPDSDIKGPSWTVQKVSRLTRVGNVWRKTALDELPELWSILKGDMSFVGPCPLEENEQRQLEHQIPGFRRRLTVRPWLIGLA